MSRESGYFGLGIHSLSQKPTLRLSRSFQEQANERGERKEDLPLVFADKCSERYGVTCPNDGVFQTACAAQSATTQTRRSPLRPRCPSPPTPATHRATKRGRVTSLHPLHEEVARRQGHCRSAPLSLGSCRGHHRSESRPSRYGGVALQSNNVPSS